MHAECQMAMNSVERVREYSELEAEKYGEDMGDSKDKRQTEPPSSRCSSCLRSSSQLCGFSQRFSAIPNDSSIDLMESNPIHGNNTITTIYVPHNWPTVGEIEFKGISLKYQSAAQPVLHSVSFRIPGRKKVGVVGRTGAGKSSLIAALFRLVEPYEGSLLIDGINILDIPLHSLRSKIAIVPQDPTLFKGSVRFNLDPFDQHSDEDIWTALESVHMKAHVLAMETHTDAPQNESNNRNINDSSNNNSQNKKKESDLSLKLVAEKGSNFSVGQRQLICLARAILRRAPVLVLDECTASVDHETDALIQETVRKELSHCTVLCIAHRLHTIAYYDLVLVMEKGQVAEFADPFSLMSSGGSLFRSLCESSGDFDELLATAKAVAQK